MKKTIFTFCSIAAVCCAIFFACAKDDNSITHVTYASQTSSNGTGGNPNPNGLPATSGTGVTTATTGTTTGSTTSTPPGGSGSFTANSTNYTLTMNCALNGGAYFVTGTSGTTQLEVAFSSQPTTSGTYIASQFPSGTTNCQVQVVIGGTQYFGTGTGNVTVTVTGGVVSVSFTNLVVSTSGGTNLTITGSMGC
ncbi:MAG TPA: hypothetical protein VKG26_09900 [Bacteroidia bacterium]|nr:hypothetical protein [Bacteroidia bacterium]